MYMCIYIYVSVYIYMYNIYIYIRVYIYMDNGLFVDDLSIENDGFPMAMVRLAAFYRHSSPRPFGQVTFEAELRLTIATHHLVTLHLRASWTPIFGTRK